MESTDDILRELREAEQTSLDRIIPVVYRELRQIAHRQLAARRGDPTLSTTELVNEAYLKLVDQSRATPHDRIHFLSVCAIAMRHILIDRARSRMAAKRGREQVHVTFDDATIAITTQAESLLQIDDALTRLAAIRPRLAQVVELRFFGGLTDVEIAEAHGVNVRTVERDWAKARILLHELVSA